MAQNCNLKRVTYDRASGITSIYYADENGKTYLIEIRVKHLPAPFCMMSPLGIIHYVNATPSVADECLFFSPEAYYE